MKHLTSFLLAVLLAATMQAAENLPLFNATLSTGKEHRFVLVSADGKSSPFLRVGDSFEGYTVKGYDPKTATLTIERDGKSATLSLVADAAVKDAPMAAPATLADATAVLDTMNFEEMLDKTMVGIRKQQAGMVQQMTRQMGRGNADPETQEAIAEFQKKMVEEMMGGLTGAELKTDVAKIYSEIFTKQELQQLGTFYQSPLGQMLNDKQPVLTEKLNGVMTQRIMASMPRVQQMAQEFGAQMRAKQQAKAAAAKADAAGAGAPATAPTN